MVSDDPEMAKGSRIRHYNWTRTLLYRKKIVLFPLRTKPWLKAWEEGTNSLCIISPTSSVEGLGCFVTSLSLLAERTVRGSFSAHLNFRCHPASSWANLALPQVFSTWSFFSPSFMNCCASRTDFWSTAVSICLSLKATICVSPKISN